MNNKVFSLNQEKSSPEEDTIAAISTPFGESGIGIVRLSGSLAEPIARKLFKPKRESTEFIPHHFHYGEIADPERGNPIDEVLVVLMKAPKTYTREDIVEIHCHGGYLILQKVLELALDQGARMAQPGEFTRRAFLNGRIDLTQAEAVIDLIKAKTMASLDIANQQLKGLLYKEMICLKAGLVDRLALIEAHIDFPEEEMEPVSLIELQEYLRGMAGKMEEWISSYEEGRLFREGVSCVITGKTNVGKSSLLNVLLKEDRAIVTPVPGTTRDVIEEILNIHGIPVRLMDTAGLRRAVNTVEEEGVKRAKERVADSDLVLLVLDGSQGLDEDDQEILRKIERKRKVVVVNKKDLPLKVSLDGLRSLLRDVPIVHISALKNEGMEDLKAAIYDTIIHKEVRTSPDHLIVANIRHKRALTGAKDNLSNAIKELEKGTSLEFIAFEIRSALGTLGEMVGETASEEVLDRIFGRFCIGK
ncbi:MAG TPA: tRNA uridine-5-carboxymethylaminomethyl(34) synthesis GTPase MnmE [Thermodesulfobacteriota bacterium]|nr:tRNA uridine-5-carboxymethylaminomethyl(34) synthesis GTPase MnmE [Thermodesulfobacteriota bacterium]